MDTCLQSSHEFGPSIFARQEEEDGVEMSPSCCCVWTLDSRAICPTSSLLVCPSHPRVFVLISPHNHLPMTRHRNSGRTRDPDVARALKSLPVCKLGCLSPSVCVCGSGRAIGEPGGGQKGTGQSECREEGIVALVATCVTSGDHI